MSLYAVIPSLNSTKSYPEASLNSLMSIFSLLRVMYKHAGIKRNINNNIPINLFVISSV